MLLVQAAMSMRGGPIIYDCDHTGASQTALPFYLLILYVHPPSDSSKVNLNTINLIIRLSSNGLPLPWEQNPPPSPRSTCQLPALQPPSSLNTHLSKGSGLPLPSTCQALPSAHRQGLCSNVTPSECEYSTFRSKVDGLGIFNFKLGFNF